MIIVRDRIDLDTQISATFNAADVPQALMTTIHKVGQAGGRLNERSNIIVMVDEAHRTQEGELGRKMRQALPNAFLFGLTGTPINRADHVLDNGGLSPPRSALATRPASFGAGGSSGPCRPYRPGQR